MQVGRSDRWECRKSVGNIGNRYRITAVDMPFKKFKLNDSGQVGSSVRHEDRKVQDAAGNSTEACVVERKWF